MAQIQFFQPSLQPVAVEVRGLLMLAGTQPILGAQEAAAVVSLIPQREPLEPLHRATRVATIGQVIKKVVAAVEPLRLAIKAAPGAQGVRLALLAHL
jgi:hypothetical protein